MKMCVTAWAARRRFSFPPLACAAARNDAGDLSFLKDQASWRAGNSQNAEETALVRFVAAISFSMLSQSCLDQRENWMAGCRLSN